MLAPIFSSSPPDNYSYGGSGGIGASAVLGSVYGNSSANITLINGSAGAKGRRGLSNVQTFD